MRHAGERAYRVHTGPAVAAAGQTTVAAQRIGHAQSQTITVDVP